MKPHPHPDRYARTKEVFFGALDLAAAQRDEFVRLQCDGDTELLSEVQSLLLARADVNDFLNLPAIEKISTHEHLLGKVVGGYRLVRELGEGGMGVVFLAQKEDAELVRNVALKIIRTNLDSKAIFKHFYLERQILDRLDHPNIAHLIDGGSTDDGLPYFVMEYVEGVPLVEYAKSKSLSLDERLHLFRQVCDAVAFAHKHAIIHRDLKPSNILVTPDGIVKLLDFGIAKLLSSESSLAIETLTTIRAMTPEYASPEQIKGESVTTVSDVYSLGVILYELMTEARPYQTDSKNLNDIIRQVCETDPARPSSLMSRQTVATDKRTTSQARRRVIRSLRGDLDNIILKALRKERERRYSSVEGLWQDLQRYLDRLPVSARRGTLTYRAQKFIRRNRIAVSLASLIVLVLVGGIVATVWQARRAENERARAERRFNEVRTLANSLVFEMNDEILKGQTQGRELVVKRGLEYLDRLASEVNNDVSLQSELAAAYVKIGDIQGKPYSPNLGDTEGAIGSYEKARLILEKLYQSNSASRDIQLDLSRTYAAIGSIQDLRKANPDEAYQSLQKAREIAEALFNADPKNVKYRIALADIYKSLGDLHDHNLDAVTDRSQGIIWDRKALALREELLAADPSSLQEQIAIASLHQRIAQLLETIAEVRNSPDDYSSSLAEFDQALAMYRGLLSAEQNNSRYRRDVADMTAARIPVLASLGRRVEAFAGYKGAMEIFEELAAADPKNAEARLDVALTHQLMCSSLLKLNDTTGAVRSCRLASQVGESMLTNDPTNAEARATAIRAYNLIGDALKRVGDNSGAKKSYQQALKIAEQWLTVDPQNTVARNTLASTRAHLETLKAASTQDDKGSPGKPR